MSGLRIAEVSIRNFRVLQDVWMPLAETTVLIGANNSGKTAFLDALDVAIGDRTRASEDDLFVDKDGKVAPEFVVDLLIQPADGDDEFDTDVREVVADAIQLPSSGPEFFAIRTRGAVDPKRGFDRRRKFLKGWEREAVKAAALVELAKPFVTRDVLELLSFHLLDARRDVADELRGKASFWARIAKDLNVDPTLRAQIEANLKTLGATLINASPVLADVRTELNRISEAFAPGTTGMSIEALPAHLDVLGRGMDVMYGAPGSAPISLDRHGMGTRSLAVLTIFNAFVKIRTIASGGLTIVALEEPEAHLHPQAQRAAFQLATTIPAQRIVSTHSPYIVEGVDVFNLRHFLRSGPAATVKWVDRTTAGSSTFTTEELEKLRRFLQQRHGEVLFARLVVLFEGDTEEAALPAFAEASWGKGGLHDRGLSFVNVGGSGNYRHLLVLLDRLRIPWLIFSDGDQGGVDGVTAALTAIGTTVTAASPTALVMLPTAAPGQDYEAYLIAEGFSAQIENAIAASVGPNALSDYKTMLHGQKKTKTVLRDYVSNGWEGRLLADFMDNNKAALGAPVAAEIVKGTDASGRPLFPPKVRELFDRIEARLATP
jgi:putative ATP-dependent endonuclease of OLD family